MVDEILEYKCPNCSGPLRYDEKLGKLLCDSCDSEFPLEYFEQVEDKIEFNFDSEEIQLHEYTCPSCGGVLLANENTITTRCPYCDNPQVILSKVSGVLKPKYVIPFTKTRQEAIQTYKDHCKGKYLLPADFIDDARIEEIVGMYVPFWLYDCDIEAHGSYNCIRTRSWSDRNYIYTRHDYYRVLRDGIMHFNHVPVDGSKKMEDDYMQSIEPYNYNELTPFALSYLGGFVAEKYDIDQNVSKNIAINRMKETGSAILRNSIIGYTSVINNHINVSVTNGDEDYALLPVWILTTKYKDSYYRFMMNGQTGKFIGELPCDYPKMIRTILLIALIIFTIALLCIWVVM